MFVHVVNGIPRKLTPAEVAVHLQSNNTSPPGDLSQWNGSEFGIYPLTETTPPTPSLDEIVTEAVPALVNGVWTQQWALTTKPVRASLRRGEWKKALEARSRWAAFKTYVASLPGEEQLEWHYAETIDRNGPLITALQAATGLTNAQLNAVFRV